MVYWLDITSSENKAVAQAVSLRYVCAFSCPGVRPARGELFP